MTRRPHSRRASGPHGLSSRVGGSERTWLVAVFVLSVLLRISVALYLGDIPNSPPLLVDQVSYHSLAERVLSGHGFSFGQRWYPFSKANSPTAHWSFLYTLFISGVYALFGVHPLAVRMVQSVIGGILLPLVAFRLSRQLFRDHVAVHLCSAAIAAVYPYFVLHAATVMTETFYIVLVLYSLEVSLRLIRDLYIPRHVPVLTAIELGGSIGLAALMRQAILPWAPVLFLMLLWHAWRGSQIGPGIVRLSIAGLVVLACVLPWTYRNYRAYDEFLLLNSNTGYAMYSAQHPMHGVHFREHEGAPIPEELWALNEAQIEPVLLRLGVQFVLDDPRRYLLLCLSRIRALVKFWPSPETSLLHNIGRTASATLYMPLALAGIVLVHRNGELPRGSWLLATFMIFYSTLHILTWAKVRYRLPVDAAALPFAGSAVMRLWQIARHWIARA